MERERRKHTKHPLWLDGYAQYAEEDYRHISQCVHAERAKVGRSHVEGRKAMTKQEALKRLYMLREAMNRVAQIEYVYALDVAISAVKEMIAREDDGK